MVEDLNVNTSQEDEITFKVEPRVKEEFLETQIKSTRKFYSYVLQKADSFEYETGIKIYDLNIEERDELMLVKFKNKTIGAFQANLSPLKKYVDFCIGKNLVTHYENRFSLILPKFYENYINVQAMVNSYIPKSKVRELEKQLINYQDQLYIELLSWAVRGRTEKGNTLEEIINLKVSDVHFDEKVLYLTNNDGEGRTLQVDDFTIDLIKKTIDCDFYVFGNGFTSKKDSEGNYTKNEKGFIINPTEFVFRIPGKNKSGKIDHQLIANRIQRIQEWTGSNYLNISSLWFSAMIDAAKVIKEEKGELTKEDYISLNERFSYGGTDGEKYYNRTREMINLYV